MPHKCKSLCLPKQAPKGSQLESVKSEPMDPLKGRCSGCRKRGALSPWQNVSDLTEPIAFRSSLQLDMPMAYGSASVCCSA